MKRIILAVLAFFSVASLLAQQPIGSRISFFTEQTGNDLLALASDSVSVRQLQVLKASLKVGVSDTSEATVRALRLLDSAQVPMVAWLLLPASEDTYFHVWNSQKAKPRYEEFKAWSKRNGIRWAGIGLGLVATSEEPSLDMASETMERLSSEERFHEAQQAYQRMIHQAQSDGYRVEVYMPPILFDERKAGTMGYQLLAGIPALQADMEIPMVFTSLEGDESAWAIASYAKESGVTAIGVGIVGSSALVGKTALGLNALQLERDLKMAIGVQEVVIATWEGCIGQGIMPKLIKFDWTPATQGNIAEKEEVRKQTQLVLQALHYPWLVLGISLFLVFIFFVTMIRIFSRIFGR